MLRENRGSSIMLPLVEFPEVVERYAPWFEKVFSPQAYIEFKRYVSGLMVLENKTVEGINRLMVVEERNQSSLNRLLNRNPFFAGGIGRGPPGDVGESIWEPNERKRRPQHR